MKNKRKYEKGVTLIELMIVVAIIAVISAIAIPAYQGYVKEARLTIARTNIDSLRLFLEDYRLDNGCYAPGCPSTAPAAFNRETIFSNFGWNPRDDDGMFDYILSVTNDSYTANVLYPSGSTNVLVSCLQNSSSLSCNYTE